MKSSILLGILFLFAIYACSDDEQEVDQMGTDGEENFASTDMGSDMDMLGDQGQPQFQDFPVEPQQTDLLANVQNNDQQAVGEAQVQAPVDQGQGQAYANGTFRVYKASRLNVRSGPGLNYPIVGFLNAGQVVTQFGIHGRWKKISSSQGHWASGRYMHSVTPGKQGAQSVNINNQGQSYGYVNAFPGVLNYPVAATPEVEGYEGNYNQSYQQPPVLNYPVAPTPQYGQVAQYGNYQSYQQPPVLNYPVAPTPQYGQAAQYGTYQGNYQNAQQPPVLNYPVAPAPQYGATYKYSQVPGVLNYPVAPTPQALAVANSTCVQKFYPQMNYALSKCNSNLMNSVVKLCPDLQAQADLSWPQQCQ